MEYNQIKKTWKDMGFWDDSKGNADLTLFCYL